jgi:hypothetical protein
MSDSICSRGRPQWGERSEGPRSAAEGGTTGARPGKK